MNETLPAQPVAPLTSVTEPLPARTVTVPSQMGALPASGEIVFSGSGGAVSESWTAERGQTLHKVMSDWCRRANVEFQWQAEYDYPIEASLRFNGSFEDAVRNLLIGFENAQPQPIAQLHTNPGAGQTILIVQTRGNTSTD
jgi:type IV pili sensor histidine kinase/response regulator